MRLAALLLLASMAFGQSALERILAQGKVVVGGGLPLQLDEVLDSVDKNYPPLLATLQDRSIAEADLLSAQGRFDLTLRARVDTRQTRPPTLDPAASCSIARKRNPGRRTGRQIPGATRTRRHRGFIFSPMIWFEWRGKYVISPLPPDASNRPI